MGPGSGLRLEDGPHGIRHVRRLAAPKLPGTDERRHQRISGKPVTSLVPGKVFLLSLLLLLRLLLLFSTDMYGNMQTAQTPLPCTGKFGLYNSPR